MIPGSFVQRGSSSDFGNHFFLRSAGIEGSISLNNLTFPDFSMQIVRQCTGIFEVMELSEPLRELIMRRVSTTALREAAVEQGMRTLRDAGLAYIYDGVTTIEEVARETVAEEK